jgi:hypothetical protein
MGFEVNTLKNFPSFPCGRFEVRILFTKQDASNQLCLPRWLVPRQRMQLCVFFAEIFVFFAVK